MTLKIIIIGLFALGGLGVGWNLDVILAEAKLVSKHTRVSGSISSVLMGFLFAGIGGLMTSLLDLFGLTCSMLVTVNHFLK